MKFAYTYSEVRALDKRVAFGTLEYMERAGGALAQSVKKTMSERGVGDVLFVCGGGNNGGDGFVAARILLSEGIDATVLCIAEHFSEACEAEKKTFGGDVLGRIPRRRYALIVDCLFGTGISREPSGENAALIDFINSADYVIACDVPSGLGEGGVALDKAVRADKTVTMGALKAELMLSDGVDFSGQIEVVEIGLCPACGGARILDREDVSEFFPKRKSHSNKGDYGRAAIVAGERLSGASVLSVLSALKSGAGYVEFYVPQEAVLPTVLRLPAAIVKEHDGVMLHANSIAIGMGAGVGKPLYEKLKFLLANFEGTLVVDADALTSISLFGTDILKKKKCDVIVTPHLKEFSRLTGISTGEILRDPIRYAKEFSGEYGVVTALKNNRSVITDGKEVYINPTGCAALAKGGSGDILCGLITGIAARKIAPLESAALGCYLLGRAGEIVARERGEYGSTATDIIEAIAAAINEIAQ